jgi:HEAT repeat protein
MFSKLLKLIKIQPEEVRLFLWTAVLFFLIRGAGLIFDNFAETTFLKRFGVQYLPLVYAANAILTFIIMGAMMGVIRKTPSARLLSWLMVFCGVSVGLLRLVVALKVSLVYPVLFLLRAQYMALQALIFWNLANDLFNTRQSKRLFPLLAAGGVLGAIAGSFGTPALADTVGVDDLMLAYMATTVAAGAVVWRMSRIFPTLSVPEKGAEKDKKLSLKEEIKEIWPLMRQSTLVKIMILLTLLPNILIPIMNYQFNLIVNSAFGTEGGLIGFLAYFYGVMNVISLVILLFVGQIYSRWGLPVALMFHPANYVLAFLALFFRFDVVSAVYARISTNILRVTINNPAREVLMGLFPAGIRPLIRPFLRGTVVRVGILVGSGLILVTELLLKPSTGLPAWFEPYFTWGPAATAVAVKSNVVGVSLALMGAIIGLGWMATSIWLKRSYSSILMDLISRDVVDLKSLETGDVSQMFSDKQAREQLIQACQTTRGPVCVWYAELMKSQGVKDVDRHLLELIRDKDEETVIGLLPLLPEGMDPEAVDTFERLVDPDRPGLTRALAQAAVKLPPDNARRFLEDLLQTENALEVQATAVAGLYPGHPSQYRSVIDAWLDSADPQRRLAGVIAAGGSGDPDFLARLHRLLARESDRRVTSQILIALNQLHDPRLWNLVLARLGTDAVPIEVLRDFPITSDNAVRAFIKLLGEDDDQVRALAQDKLREAPYHNTQLMIEWLAVPQRRIREGLFELMESLQITDLEIIAFGRSETERAYRNLVEAEALMRLAPESDERDLLARHLREKKDERLETIIRVLATQGDPGRMRMVLRGLSSADGRLRSNALEALESMVGRNLSRAMMPLLENLSPAESLAAGRRLFNIRRDFGSGPDLFRHLLAKHDWVTLYLTLLLVAGDAPAENYGDRIEPLTGADNDQVARLARRLLGSGPASPPREATMSSERADQPAAETSLTEKILLLRGMDMLAGLGVSQLAAVASVVEEVDYAPGQVIINEGEVGEEMYLIVSGSVVVTKRAEDGCDVDLDTLGVGTYFGEMALFDQLARSATVTTKEQTSLLVLHKREFAETVREYPEVALQMCKELSRRLRGLHEKIQALPICF